VQNSDSNGRFHSDWCSMIYSRLLLARNLLTDDGVIFISIDEHESHNLRKICDDVFGSSNFLSNIVWEKRYTRSNNAKRFTTLTEPIMCYAKSTMVVEDVKEKRNEKADSIYTNPDNDPRGVWTSVSYVNPATKDQRPNLSYPLFNPITGKEVVHPTNAWKYEKSTYEQHVAQNKLYWGKNGENVYPRLKKFLSEMDGGMVPVDLWSHEDSGSTDLASKELENLLGRKIFDFPKPKELIKRLLSLIINGKSANDFVVLDFFSGSATTAHAVMQLNADDGGHRKFILVQLPEKCDESSEAAKAGYKNICEIGKERIRRAGAKILAEKQAEQQKSSEKNDLFDAQNVSDNNAKTLDIGFRVLKIDDSNMKDVYYSAGEVSQQNLLDQISNIKEDRTDMDLLFGCLVDWGVSLSLPINTETIEGVTIHNVNGGDLIASFSENIPETVIRQIAAKKPLRVVFRDSSFRDAPSKINVTEIFKTLSPNTTVKVI
ncbi:MAG: site-specific DNA-methyltransferase, partial [Bacteroidaceae bacterium]|nr:site-specific DNA-methyltransferase [Bacteroidaceae bacterium]